MRPERSLELGPDAQYGLWMQGKEKDKADEAQRNDHYDYEDDFIDDSEFVEYYEGGDRRKAKYSGFFINKGAVEKVPDCSCLSELQRAHISGSLQIATAARGVCGCRCPSGSNSSHIGCLYASPPAAAITHGTTCADRRSSGDLADTPKAEAEEARAAWG